MSGYTSDLREYINPGRGETKPRQYSDPNTYNLIDHVGTIGHTGTTYGNGSNLGLVAGFSIYAKPGNVVAFYEDSLGARQVGPSGGKGGQDNPPTRSESEFVGTFTGKATKEFIEVTWVNKWWQNASWKPWVPFATIKKGEYKTENKTSWVRFSQVEGQEEFVPASDRQDAINEEKALQDALNVSSGNVAAESIDTTTLGVIAIGAALFLKRKKKKK